MSHYTYIEKRQDLRPYLDAVCGWAEWSFCVGGIAWHKVEELERRLDKLIPVQGQLNKTYSASDNVTFNPERTKAVHRLHMAWALLRKLSDLDDKATSQRTQNPPTAEEWNEVFVKVRALFKEYDTP
jgi:hypothetical protein